MKKASKLVADGSDAEPHVKSARLRCAMFEKDKAESPN
jgi:hypothetical protein